MSREITIIGNVARVPLSRGYVATIDSADVSLVEGRKWSAHVTPRRRAVYAVRVEQKNGKKTMILMHRLFVDIPSGMEVDHIDGDGLNNRRSNLRACTRAENTMNVAKRSDNKSGFKGVFFEQRAGKWRAEIRANGKGTYIGYFATAELAAEAYQKAALKHHGEFARTK